MTNLVIESLEYFAQSDRFLRTLAVGGIVTFVQQLFLGAVRVSVTSSSDVVTGSFTGGASVVILGGLTTLGLVSFVVLAGYYVRIAERVIAGEKTPPELVDGKRLVFDGTLFSATLIAIIAVVLAVQLAVFAILVASVTAVEVFLGVLSTDTVLFPLSVLFAVVTAIVVVYPQPSIWIVIGRFRLWDESDRSYLRFVASRRFLSELGSILFSWKYATTWVALVVVSMLQGAATIEAGSVFTAGQPVALVARLNTMLVSSIVGFYVSVAVVYLFATRFRETVEFRQTSVREFESPRESS